MFVTYLLFLFSFSYLSSSTIVLKRRVARKNAAEQTQIRDVRESLFVCLFVCFYFPSFSFLYILTPLFFFSVRSWLEQRTNCYACSSSTWEKQQQKKKKRSRTTSTFFFCRCLCLCVYVSFEHVVGPPPLPSLSPAILKLCPCFFFFSCLLLGVKALTIRLPPPCFFFFFGKVVGQEKN